ncbi:MAG: tetraacyldisaccharide 4'-kinase [Labilithrix sp.]|nr:tetraacyldisaccharide 4'-kinase [Labilithrix sp.]
MSLSRGAARALEEGRWDGLVARALASAFAPVAARGVARAATVPPEIALVCVGGATLGGSGKTRVAIACARELASRGVRVALVGHAYRASLPARARVVSEGDRLRGRRRRGLVCARALARWAVPVVVRPTRRAAIDRAASLAPRPDVAGARRSARVRGRRERSLSLLAVRVALGERTLPPAGDICAPRTDVLSAGGMRRAESTRRPTASAGRVGEGPRGLHGTTPDAGASPITPAPQGTGQHASRRSPARTGSSAPSRRRAFGPVVSVAMRRPTVTARVRDAGVGAWIARPPSARSTWRYFARRSARDPRRGRPAPALSRLSTRSGRSFE